MKLFINAGNQGYPMGSATAELIKSWGFDGVRTSLSLYAPEGSLTGIIDELAKHGLWGLFIVGGWQVWHPRFDANIGLETEQRIAHDIDDIAAQAFGVARLMDELGCSGWIECGNEPDITKGLDEQRFVDQCHASRQAVQQASPMQPFITGGVSNLSERGGLKYLRNCLNKGLVRSRSKFSVGVHPYRTDLFPWSDFEGRPMAHILADVRNEAGSYAITEIGWHTATQKSGSWPCRKKFAFNDIEVKDFAEWDLDLALVEGSELYAWYNFNDGSENVAIDRYGIRVFDTFDQAKPIVETFQTWNPLI